jgi:serine protease Do
MRYGKTRNFAVALAVPALAALLSTTDASAQAGPPPDSGRAATAIRQLAQLTTASPRGWIGVKIQSVTEEVASALGLARASGALVAEVEPGGPAANAGLRAGDVILKLDAHNIADYRDLPPVVASAEVGRTVGLVVLRNGREQTIRVAVAASPAPPAAAVRQDPIAGTAALLGLTVEQRSDGLAITKIAPGSGADNRGLKVGEFIVAVGTETVKTPQDLFSSVSALKAQGRKAALLRIAGNAGQGRFVAIPYAATSGATPVRPAPDDLRDLGKLD